MTQAKKKKVSLVMDEDNPVSFEILETAIVDVAKGMAAINKTRLTREAIVALIHDKSRLLKRDIHLVLNNLDQIEKLWLKPLEKTK